MTKELLPLLQTSADNICDKVIVCGDPRRADVIATYLDNAEEIAFNREYKVINGTYNDAKISVASHGVGAAGAAVCFKELIKGGAKEIIRVGTAGSLSLDIRDGALVIATAAIREDGLTDQLVRTAYPAIADSRITDKLSVAARNKLGKEAPRGIILTAGVFYPEIDELPNNYYSRAGAIAVEMEASVLFVLASLHNVAAGGIFAIDGIAIDFAADEYNPHRDLVAKAIDDEIIIALEALSS